MNLLHPGYGLVMSPAIGHLNPMVALGLERIPHGHSVLAFTEVDGARKLAGLPLV